MLLAVPLWMEVSGQIDYPQRTALVSLRQWTDARVNRIRVIDILPYLGNIINSSFAKNGPKIHLKNTVERWKANGYLRK